ncbi:MAG TPA: DUF2252 family protein [Myxococcales bacterium]|nr:DUF2252 family protein [Myxococcales bacterium]
MGEATMSEQPSARSQLRAAPEPVPEIRHAPLAERYAAGKALRDKCPRRSHAGWKPPADRRDAVEMVLAAEKGRLPDLLPLRHGRMVRSAFTFYRGAALTMAADLASTPTTGIRVQCCGDAHLCNFGGFATPERRVIFSINDLDETLPGPWEWDLKRLAASFAIASRDNGLKDSVAKEAAQTCVHTYRESMVEFSKLKTLELWSRSLPADELVADIKDPAFRARAIKRLQKERAKSIAEDIFPKLADKNSPTPVIKDQLPTIFHHFEGHSPDELKKAVRDGLAGYRDTLPSAYQFLFDQYVLRDAAIKVVGIGSVGTACWVLLFTAGDHDPLFLQVKEARASVLEPYAGPSAFDNHGQRVVDGYRRMQPASDIFLGWSQGPKRDYFVRQLRDIKISIRVESFGSAEMDLYATWCGRALALAHARSGSSAEIAGYMGKSDAFALAITDFSMRYADQNEQDHAALEAAVRSGKVKAVFEDAA